MAKIIGVVPAAILGDQTKSNMNDYYKMGNNIHGELNDYWYSRYQAVMFGNKA